MSENNNKPKRHKYRMLLEKNYAPNITIESQETEYLEGFEPSWNFVHFSPDEKTAEAWIENRLHLDRYPEEEEPHVKIIKTYYPLK